tara:strand:- start:3361 stop:3777 length:417 start_codon:yes stop_codon:yes gene_type:complete
MLRKMTLILFIMLSTLRPLDAKAFELDPRVKTFLIMNAYGAVGGLLLGTATLAFDAPGRAPFIGASLGLYAGLIFGSYVVVTHKIEEDRRLNPQNYMEDESGGYGDIENQLEAQPYEYAPGEKFQGPSFYLNLIKYNF